MLELLIVIAIASSLAGGGLLAWSDYRRALRLEQGARQLLDFAGRIQAGAYWHNETRRMMLIRRDDGWCARGGASSAATDCLADDGALFLPPSRDIELEQATDETFAFYGIRNTAQAGHITLRNPAGRVRLLISARGRLRLCGEERPLLGIPSC